MLKKLFKKSYSYKDIMPDYNLYENNCSFSGDKEYANNVIVHRSVNLIATAASHIPLLIFNRGKSGEMVKNLNHHAYSLLKRPSPLLSGADFFVSIISNKLLYGNSYIVFADSGNNIPKELYILKDIEILSEMGIIRGYKHKNEYYNLDITTGYSKLLHIKNYNPYNNAYGMSCLSAAKTSIELYNNSVIWNKNLLKNGGRPTGALIMKDGYLSTEQFTRLKEQLEEQYSGPHNAGKPLLLEGDMHWKEMSINPKDMDFMQVKNSAARDIALSFGVPPQLLGINGDNTYSNMQEARLALWEETIIPLLDKISDSLTGWLSYWYKDNIVVDFDRDAISALSNKRENLWNRINSINFMTTNEKREFLGLSPLSDEQSRSLNEKNSR